MNKIFYLTIIIFMSGCCNHQALNVDDVCFKVERNFSGVAKATQKGC